MKRFLRWWQREYGHKYINGGKGVISILLAAMMVPFVGFADLLVESARYHSAVTILDEAMDSSSLSVLADYDSYLFDRFGLLAVDQSEDITSDYRDYMQKNTESLNAWGLTDISAEGEYALTDDKILLKQIAEFSQYSAPAALAADLGLSELISALEEMTKMTDFFDITKGVGDVTGNMVTVVRDLGDLRNIADSLENAIEDYQSAYNSFASAFQQLTAVLEDRDQKQDKVNELQKKANESTQTTDISSQIEAVNKELAELEKQKSDQKITDEEYETEKKKREERIAELEKQLENALNEDKQLQDQLTAAKDELDDANNKITTETSNFSGAKTEYSNSIDILINTLIEYQAQGDKVLESMEEMASSSVSLGTSILSTEEKNLDKQKELKKQKDDLENKRQQTDDQDMQQEYQDSIDRIDDQIEDYTASSDTISAAGNVAKDEVENYSEDLQNVMKSFSKDVLGQYVNRLQEVRSSLDILTADQISSNSILDKNQYYVEITNGYVSEASIVLLMNHLEEQVSAGNLFGIINGLGTAMRSLFTTNMFFDSRLNSYISESTGYAQSDMDLILNDFSALMNLLNGTGEDITGLLNILERIYDIFQTLISLIGHLVNYLTGMATRAITTVSELLSDQCGEKILLDEYLVKNLPNRTSISNAGEITGSSLFTGYSYKNIKFAEYDNQDPILGDISALISLLSSIKNGGNDLMFSGAEAEYILVGCRSEAVNQVVTFFQVYFARLLIDLPSVLSNGEVIKIAGAATPIGAVAVYVLYVLIEPLIDTILIVNGQEISFIKTVVYFTPSGLPTLVSRLTNLGIDSNEQDKIRENAAEICGISSSENKKLKDNTGIKWKYENYLFLLMLVSIDNDTAVQRFRNIVMLEAKAYYGQGKFDIAKTYTCISGTVKGKFDPVLPLGGIAVNGLFEQKRSRMRGY